MEKTTIKNRDNIPLAITLDLIKPSKGLAFIAHGLHSRMASEQTQSAAQAFNKVGYSVVLWDSTNTYGESGGDPEKATVTNYYLDLEDVIAWSLKQSWFTTPFIVCGFSLGGLTTGLYAEKYPEKVKAWIPIAPAVSGQLTLEAEKKEVVETWQKTGIKISESKSRPGLMRKLKWSHMEDRLKYDLLPEASKLIMPVLIIVGEVDPTCPVAHQKILFKALPTSKKELHIIPGASHSYTEQKHLDEMRHTIVNWVKAL